MAVERIISAMSALAGYLSQILKNAMASEISHNLFFHVGNEITHTRGTGSRVIGR